MQLKWKEEEKGREKKKFKKVNEIERSKRKKVPKQKNGIK